MPVILDDLRVEIKCGVRRRPRHYNTDVTSKVANLSTRSVRYLESGSGAPIVLLHAFPLNAEQWLPQMTQVPPGWRLIAPDLRGFRQPDGTVLVPDGPAGIDAYTTEVLELMMHLEIKRATICGLSMGGYVALAIWRLAAARVAALVLADTRASADTDEARAGRDRMIALAETGGVSGVARAMVPKLLGATTQRDQPDLVEVVTRLIESNGKDGVQAALRAMRDRPDATPLLGTITCPVTVMVGMEDIATPPAECEAMHHAIHGSRFVTLPHAGHLSNIEHAFGFNWELFIAARK